MKQLSRKTQGDFTLKGYNDRPKPCPRRRCRGKVEPTWNANVGRCNTCGEQFTWSLFLEKAESRKLLVKHDQKGPLAAAD